MNLPLNIVTRRQWAFAMVGALMLPSVRAQDPNSVARPIRVVLASSKINIVDAGALHFKLVKVEVAAGKATQVVGDNGFIFVVHGKCEIVVGADRRSLDENEAAVIGSAPVAVQAIGRRQLVLLHYMLLPANQPASNSYPGASANELYSRQQAIPGLLQGPHELSLTRVSSPVGAPPPPMHQRSGAALYYLLSGKGMLHMQGKDERHEAGDVQYEPYGFVHTWENTGTTPLIFLQANLSREGVPEIMWLR